MEGALAREIPQKRTLDCLPIEPEREMRSLSGHLKSKTKTCECSYSFSKNSHAEQEI